MDLYSQYRDVYTAFVLRLVAQSNRTVLLLGGQIILILGIGIACFAISDFATVLAVVYGGGGAIFSTWLLIRRIRLATKIAKDMPGREVSILYMGAIQRFVLVLVLFIIGMALLKFDPLLLLIGFAAPQVVFLLGAYLYGLYPAGWGTEEVVE